MESLHSKEYFPISFNRTRIITKIFHGKTWTFPANSSCPCSEPELSTKNEN